jgi:hypothetical protein
MARGRAKPAKPAAEVDFSDHDQARAWFGGQSRDLCIALAARAALRVLPLIWRAQTVEGFPARVVLPVFRACFVARTVAEYPDQLERLQGPTSVYDAASDASDASDAAASDAAASDAAAANAAHAASAAARAVYTAPNAYDAAAYAAFAAPNAYDAAAYAAFAAAADGALRAEAVAIEQGKPRTSIVPAPLWPNGAIPSAFGEAWSALRHELLAEASAHWGPWVQWYEAVRDGRAAYPRDFTLAVATLTGHQWDEEPRPAAVNKRIADLLAEHAPPEPIPGQGAGPHFALNPDLKIALAPPTEIDAASNNVSRIRQLLPQVRQAAGDLAGHVSANSQPEISRNLSQYREAIAGEPETIAWGTVFGLGVRLENAAIAARRDIANRLQEPLEDTAQEALDSVLILHGPLILATAEGRELSDQADQFRLTREEQAALREAAQQVAAALKNSNLAEATAADLTEQAAETIGEGIHPERSGAFGLATLKNIATVLVPAAALGTVHWTASQLVGGGETGLAVGVAATALAGFQVAEITLIGDAMRALSTDIARATSLLRRLPQRGAEIVSDQAQLARAQIAARLQLLTPFRNFVSRNEEPLRHIIENSTQLRWMTRYIDFIVRMNNKS